MQYLNLKVRNEEHILHIILDRGRSNAMDQVMVDSLIHALVDAEQDPSVEGVVLSGKEGFFSSGLDLIALHSYNEEDMTRFWNRFLLLIEKLLSFPKPVVAAVTGHSPAGGCVLALCCDYRVMATGDFVIGLNEVPVGIVVPASIFELYSFWLGKAVAYRSLLEGRLYKPDEALGVGLVDELVSFDRIQTVAVRKLKTVMQFEKNAWRISKLNMRSTLIAAVREGQDEVVKQLLEQWWRPSTREIMRTIIFNLTQRK